jgi:hypothetical protein
MPIKNPTNKGTIVKMRVVGSAFKISLNAIQIKGMSIVI